jgi:hypothetical protein
MRHTQVCEWLGLAHVQTGKQRNGRLTQGMLALGKSSFCDTALPLASDRHSFRHFNTLAASQQRERR